MAILFSPNLQFVHISLIFRQLILGLDSEQLKTIILRYIKNKKMRTWFLGLHTHSCRRPYRVSSQVRAI